MKHDERAHSIYGPSSMKRIMLCPAAAGLIAKAPPTPEHPSAKEGTLTHECLEALNRNTNGIYNVMEELGIAGHPFERIKRAEKAYWQIQKIREKFPGSEFHPETRVDISHFTEEGTTGTVDAAIVEHFGTLTIVDYKNGVMPVEPEENVQGICYALGFANLHDYNFENVAITIIQPNSRVAKRTLTTWKVSMKKLRTWESKIQTAVDASKKKNPPCIPNPECYFCPAKNFNCPAHTEKRSARALDLLD